MLSEVEWGAHESSLFLYLEQIDHDGEPHESSLFIYLEKLIMKESHTFSSVKNKIVHDE